METSRHSSSTPPARVHSCEAGMGETGPPERNVYKYHRTDLAVRTIYVFPKRSPY